MTSSSARSSSHAKARDPVLCSCPVDESQNMLLVDFARGVRVNLAGGNGPTRFRRGSRWPALPESGFPNRHQAVQALNRLTDNALARAHTPPFLDK